MSLTNKPTNNQSSSTQNHHKPKVLIPNSKSNISRQTSENVHSSTLSEFNKDRLFFGKGISLTFICIAIILISVNMRSPIVMLGSIAPMIEQALHIGQTQIGWLGSIPMVMFAIGAVLSPRLGRRFGLHNLLPVMILCLCLGMLLRVAVLDWWVFFIGTTLLSLAIGFLNTIVMPAIKQLAPNNIALVTGVYSFALTIFAGLSAGVIVPMSELMGWRMATASWAIVTVVALICWWLLRPYLQTHQPNQPQNRPQNQPQSQPQSQPKEGQQNQPQEEQQDEQNILTNDNAKQSLNMWKLPMAWHFAIFFGLQSLMYYLMASFLPSMWMGKGFSLGQAGQLAMLFQFMSPIAIIILTMLMNYANKTKVNLVRVIAVSSSLLISIGSAGMTFMDFDGYSFGQMLFWANLWTVVLGFGASMVFTLCLMLMSMRTHNTEQAGDLSAMSQTVAYLIAIVGPLGAGWLHEQSGGWYLPLIILTVLMSINVIFAWTASKAVMIDGEKIPC